jgi:hypothetical protein
MDDLQAGRELDALVAEKVMGIKCGVCLQDGQLEPITMDWREIPHYFTDIAAAWEVHLEACSWLFSKRRQYLRALQEQARTENGELVAWPDVLVVLRDRMPEAICLAALEVSKDGTPTSLKADANQCE